MEITLWKIFENINKWIDYAEKKNAIILTFIGIQITLLKLFIPSIKGLVLFGILFLSFCLIFSVVSFFPIINLQNLILKLSLQNIKKNRKNNSMVNIIYFGDIVNFSKQEYIEHLENIFKTRISDNTYLVALCEQILANSTIALRKFLLFRICAFLMIIGQTLFALSFFY
jgi:hypothetical protein